MTYAFCCKLVTISSSQSQGNASNCHVVLRISDEISVKVNSTEWKEWKTAGFCDR